MLLVSLSLWNETGLLIHCSPVAGESGWMYILLGISGSALPATSQHEFWNLEEFWNSEYWTELGVMELGVLELGVLKLGVMELGVLELGVGYWKLGVLEL